jgi:hypothetical protein
MRMRLIPNSSRGSSRPCSQCVVMAGGPVLLPRLFDMRCGIAAVAVLAILTSGCGNAATLRAPSAKTPLSLPASLRLCPSSDAKPRLLLLGKTATDVLIPGHPTSALICRYWGKSGQIPEPEDERARIPEGEHGHAVYTIAQARRVVRQDVTSYLTSELDALRPIGPHPNCDEVLGERSELIVFYYRGGREARVIFYAEGCVAVRNGRTARYGLGMGHGNGEEHWADEALL